MSLKLSHGFTRPLPSVVTVLTIAASVWMLATAVKSLPIGTAYAVWVGIGAAGTAIGGIVAFGEPASTARVLLLLVLVGSIIGLKIVSPTG